MQQHLGCPQHLVASRSRHSPILPSMRIFTTLDEVAAAAGEELGTSDWLTIDQERVNQFADATGDHQWIHVDVERAKDGPVRRHHRARLPHPVADPVARQPGLLPRDPGRQAQLRRQQGPLPEPGPRRLADPQHDLGRATSPTSRPASSSPSSTSSRSRARPSRPASPRASSCCCPESAGVRRTPPPRATEGPAAGTDRSDQEQRGRYRRPRLRAAATTGRTRPPTRRSASDTHRGRHQHHEQPAEAHQPAPPASACVRSRACGGPHRSRARRRRPCCCGHGDGQHRRRCGPGRGGLPRPRRSSGPSASSIERPAASPTVNPSNGSRPGRGRRMPSEVTPTVSTRVPSVNAVRKRRFGRVAVLVHGHERLAVTGREHRGSRPGAPGMEPDALLAVELGVGPAAAPLDDPSEHATAESPQLVDQLRELGRAPLAPRHISMLDRPGHPRPPSAPNQGSVGRIGRSAPEFR